MIASDSRPRCFFKVPDIAEAHPAAVPNVSPVILGSLSNPNSLMAFIVSARTDVFSCGTVILFRNILLLFSKSIVSPCVSQTLSSG